MVDRRPVRPEVGDHLSVPAVISSTIALCWLGARLAATASAAAYGHLHYDVAAMLGRAERSVIGEDALVPPTVHQPDWPR